MKHDPQRDLLDCILYVCAFASLLAALYGAVL